METIYNFSVKDADLNDVRLSDFKNQIVLIVNVASYCGLTYQYKGLEKLYKKYQNKGFEILGFPCNQFAFQEPGTNEEIQEFCDTNYGISFKIMNKINKKAVTKGADSIPGVVPVLYSAKLRGEFEAFITLTDHSIKKTKIVKGKRDLYLKSITQAKAQNNN